MSRVSKILFTGAPGSKWSSIAQTLEAHEIFNTTDRTPERTYTHHQYSGHVGAYFGSGMEFPPRVDIIENAYSDPTAGVMLAKSHEWLTDTLPGFLEYYCEKYGVWIMMVYRPNDVCIEWWQSAGGFSIDYPNYSFYCNNAKMAYHIREQNEAMLHFASEHNLPWHQFTNTWVKNTFGIELQSDIRPLRDVLVTVYRP